MLENEDLEVLLEEGLKTGADFSEVFLEETEEVGITFLDGILKNVSSNYRNGVGVRLKRGDDIVYGSTPICDKSSLLSFVKRLSFAFQDEVEEKGVSLNERKMYSAFAPSRKDEELKELFYKLDKRARKNPKVNQVRFYFYKSKKQVQIASSEGKNAVEERYIERLTMTVYVKEGEKSASYMETIGESRECLSNFDELCSMLDKTVEYACHNLDAAACPGGEMSVVIASGFGGVLFHEAAGHALEATLARDHLSVLSCKLGEKIASDVVTLIDDGRIPNAWGTTQIDDEGNETRRNVLIEKGVLKNYLVDYASSSKMGSSANGCSRRESFHYAPTSRMNNTYLEKGTSTLEEMIQSVDYGLYCISMPGGQVIPSTGDFNFGVSSARMIRNGRLSEYVKGVSLIGNIKNVLYDIEMVGDDLKLSTGYCGSVSGMVPVCIGQPSIKVRRMTVGGDQVS